MESFTEFDVLWIQSTPAIAAIFHHKYLQFTNSLYCPYSEKPITIRQTFRRIQNALLTNDKKRLALYFLPACSALRRETIISLFRRSQSNFSCYCLSIPITEYQNNMLLGWSAGLGSDIWSQRCQAPYDDDYFSTFTPDTLKSGCSIWEEFKNQPFVISDEKFFKRALIVDLNKGMCTFDMENGICFNKGIDDAIRGLIAAATFCSSPSTLVWIIDESILYGDDIKNTLQERRERLLIKCRQALRKSVESFDSSIPIYCFILDYFYAESTSLLSCLAQIQHRHHLCYSKSIMLKGTEEDKSFIENSLKIKLVSLNTMAIYNESKWKDMFLADIEKIDHERVFENFKYISPSVLNVEYNLDSFKIPLLSIENSGPLTLSEPIGKLGTLHTVSAKSVDIFDRWTKTIMDYTPEEEGTIVLEPEYEMNQFDKARQLITTEHIESFINNSKSLKKGEAILELVHDTSYNLESNDTMSIQGKIKLNSIENSVMIRFDNQGMIELAVCSCEVGSRFGNCKHCVAILVCFKEHPDCFLLKKPADFSSSSPPSTKRIFLDTESDNNDSKKIKVTFEREYKSDATLPYHTDSFYTQSSLYETSKGGVQAGGSNVRNDSDATQPYNYDELDETRPYNYNDLDATQPYNYDDLDATQPYNYNDLDATQPYNHNDLDATQPYNYDDLDATQPYNQNDVDVTQPYNYNDLDATQPYNYVSESNATQPYNHDSGPDFKRPYNDEDPDAIQTYEYSGDNEEVDGKQNNIYDATTQPYDYKEDIPTPHNSATLECNYDADESHPQYVEDSVSSSYDVASIQLYDHKVSPQFSVIQETQEVDVRPKDPVMNEIIIISSDSSSLDKSQVEQININSHNPSIDDESSRPNIKSIVYLDFDDDDDDDCTE